MQFTTHNDPATIRRGTLHFSTKDKSIQTPALIAYSIRGSVPHLVPDNLNLLPVDMVHVALEHFVEQSQPPSFKYTKGLHSYINLPNHLLFCDVRDASKLDPAAANTESYVAVDTHGGVRKVTTDVWIKAIEAYRPDWAATPADVIKAGEDVKNKRIRKASDRTLRWLETCQHKAKELNIPLFAPVVGYNNDMERIRSAKATAEKDVDGFVLNAFELEGEGWIDAFETSLKELPTNKPKLAYGLSTPERILKGVSIGIDMFDNSYAYEMTEKGRAITFRFGQPSLPTTKTIDLWEESMSQSFIPLDPSCTCYSCSTPHSRAYIHHLLDAHEMLGPLLLMIHNVFQLEQFMISVRKSIDEGRFEQDMQSFLNTYSSMDDEGVALEDNPMKKKQAHVL
ncbi:hypothetical protein O0I10_006563 [Lichtheimia ornata]|uniref:Queuine tRNA-ribosyltransferase accessory subunit 2 n=1 Tax=Lichtheimia ornata TaxID=688661 RepID=A0AAD7V338_9FUNG|nr:uncharacterized protein O0I10_006563 [Lichtheimia ornata]KAJ8657748.1 hypothetical protein O0I10_006563 [Lichtheimia ornata]